MAISFPGTAIRRDKHPLSTQKVVPVAQRRSLPQGARCAALPQTRSAAMPSDQEQATPMPETQLSFQTGSGYLRLPRNASMVRWLLTIGGVLFALYLLYFLVMTGVIALSTRWNYGPNPTAITRAQIEGVPTTITTSNVAGTIYVTLWQQSANGTLLSRTCTGPTLAQDAWGSLYTVVATAEVKGGGIIAVHLVGNVSFGSFPAKRPTLTFLLVPDKQEGCKVVQPAQSS